MTQFDVFANPVALARRSYPFVVVLQADVAGHGHERAVAPAAPRAAFQELAGRLTPIMTVDREQFVLLVTSVTTVPARSLGPVVTSMAHLRDDILSAIDHLFFGI